jgi:hypothetical protein
MYNIRRYAKKGGASRQQDTEGAEKSAAAVISSSETGAAYSMATMRSLAAVDEGVINYELLAALMTCVVREQQAHGPAACMAGWAEGLDALKQVCVMCDTC